MPKTRKSSKRSPDTEIYNLGNGLRLYNNKDGSMLLNGFDILENFLKDATTDELRQLLRDETMPLTLQYCAVAEDLETLNQLSNLHELIDYLHNNHAFHLDNHPFGTSSKRDHRLLFIEVNLTTLRANKITVIDDAIAKKILDSQEAIWITNYQNNLKALTDAIDNWVLWQDDPNKPDGIESWMSHSTTNTAIDDTLRRAQHLIKQQDLIEIEELDE